MRPPGNVLWGGGAWAGAGQSVTFKEMTDRIIALVGGGKETVGAEERFRPDASEVMELICKRSKAKELPGWEPQVPLDKGLARPTA